MGRQITPPGHHRVEQGDYLAKLAKWYGVPKWQTIWEHGQNAELRQSRKSPHVLLPGDQILIPEVSPKEESCATEKKHRFKLIQQLMKYRMKLLDGNNDPRPNVKYELIVDGESFSGLRFEGQTDGGGKLEHELPNDAENGLLQLEEMTLRLCIGHLDPLDEITGQQARLKNLGYYQGEVDGIDGPELRQAIEAFQTDYFPTQVDGEYNSQTKSKLRDLYGC